MFKAPAQSKTGVTPSQKSKVFYQNTLVYESVSISIKDNLYAYRKIKYWLCSAGKIKESKTLYCDTEVCDWQKLFVSKWRV